MIWKNLDAKAMEIPLTSQTEAIVNRYLAMGYTSAASVIEDALLRMDRQMQGETDWLKAEVQKGLESGDAVPYDLDAIVMEADSEFEAGIFDVNSYALPQH
ncbi:type II toxin-antitoxin system ParD family antitoxin [Scytonema sp. NUACC26]|uniref:ribbon-helix-helix domain-containing protein n=1 Tax=Scytonema sp. NUACC26 TaxID=3140176 RepID=UPI0034DBA515